jgi:hypothetical protein
MCSEEDIVVDMTGLEALQLVCIEIVVGGPMVVVAHMMGFEHVDRLAAVEPESGLHRDSTQAEAQTVGSLPCIEVLVPVEGNSERNIDFHIVVVVLVGAELQ